MSDQGMRLFAVFLGFPVLLLAYRCQSPNQDHQMVTSSKSNSVSLFLPSQPSSDVFHMVWKKDNKVMAKAKNISNVLTFRNKTILFPNGTLLLYSLLKQDRGLFQLEIFSDSGTCLFWGSIMLDVQDPVSKPVLSQISWQNETVNLKCEVQRGDNVSIQWLERPCGTNSSWVRTMRGFTLSVERGTSREFICTAMNNISQETSNALTVDCHDGAAPEIVSNSGDEPMRRDTASDQIIVLLLCAFASLLVSVTIFLVFFSIAQRKRKTGVMETKVGSFAVRDQQVLQMLKEEVYVDMSLETIARTVPEMSSFGPMEAPWNAQETETDAIYVPMNTANSKEETVPASEISQPATQPSGEEQVSDVSSGNDRRQVVYAEVNFSSKEQSKCSSSPTVGQSQ